MNQIIAVAENYPELKANQNFSESWTDEELYAKYSLNEEEIAFIESMIKPME